MKKYLLSALLQIFWLIGMAQSTGSIKGKVLSAHDVPVESAHVQLRGTTMITATDSNGTFLFENILPGQYKVVTTAIGFQKAERDIRLQAGQRIHIYITLHETDNPLEEVVVTGTMREVAHTNSPIPVEIVTPRLFRKNPVSNIFESMQMVNGIQPQINCNVCGTGDIHINGMEGPYTMVTIDGMPIVSSLATVYGLMGIPNSLVQRVEIVKGPSSTLYGSEAMAGVINIITKNPADAPGFSVDYFSTTQAEMNLDIGIKAKLRHSYSLIGANLFWLGNKMDVNNDNFTDVPLQTRFSVFNKWQFVRKNQKQASVAARWLYENRWGGQMQWTWRWRGTDSIYGESILTDRLEIIGNYDLPVKENIKIQYSYNYHHQNSVYGTVKFLATQHIAFSQLIWNKKWGNRNDILIGLPFRYQYYDDNTPATASAEGDMINKPDHIILPGVFIQDEIMLHQQFTILTGLRYDYNNRHRHIVSPRVSIKYKINQYNTLRLSGGNGFRVVNLFTEDHAALTGSREVVITSNLKPEQSWNINLNYNRFIAMKNGFSGIDANVFYTYFTNKIVGDFFTDPDKIFYSNLNGHGISRGFSVNNDLSLTNGLKVITGITIADVFQQIRDSVRTKTPQLHNPLFSATFTFSYHWQRPSLMFDFTGRVNSPMHLPVQPKDFRPEKSPWFGLLNFQITRLFKSGFEIYAGIKNILNFMPRYPIMRPHDPFDKYINDSISNPHGYTFDTAYNYAPVQGIRGFVGFRYGLK